MHPDHATRRCEIVRAALKWRVAGDDGVRFRDGVGDMDWIYWVKLVHTLIFFFASGCILYVVYCGVVGKTNRYLWAALGIVLAIGIIYAANGFECPVATLVHRLAGRRDVPDIFFPDWFARNIMSVSTVIYIFGVALVARNQYRERKSNFKSTRPRYPAP